MADIKCWALVAVGMQSNLGLQLVIFFWNNQLCSPANVLTRSSNFHSLTFKLKIMSETCLSGDFLLKLLISVWL